MFLTPLIEKKKDCTIVPKRVGITKHNKTEQENDAEY